MDEHGVLGICKSLLAIRYGSLADIGQPICDVWLYDVQHLVVAHGRSGGEVIRRRSGGATCPTNRKASPEKSDDGR